MGGSLLSSCCGALGESIVPGDIFWGFWIGRCSNFGRPYGGFSLMFFCWTFLLRPCRWRSVFLLRIFPRLTVWLRGSPWGTVRHCDCPVLVLVLHTRFDAFLGGSALLTESSYQFWGEHWFYLVVVPGIFYHIWIEHVAWIFGGLIGYQRYIRVSTN